jgi:hypothetical protein
MAALPDEEFTAISTYLEAEGEANLAAIRAAQPAQHAAVNASRVAAGMLTIEDEDAAIASEMGIQNLDLTRQSDLFRVAKTMYGIGAESWGFVVVKTWGYKAEERERWGAFWKRWEEVSDMKLRNMGAVGDLREGFAGRLQWFLVEDEERLGGKSVEEVRGIFADLVQDEGGIPNGLDLDLCLMVDEETVGSLLDGEREEAFVVGVDVNSEETEDGQEDEYPGHFKISVDVVVPELWETLQRQAPYELYPGGGEIYKGIMG